MKRRLLATPLNGKWECIRTTSGRFRYIHSSLFNIQYTDKGPWLYCRLSKSTRSTRWCYDIRFKHKTRCYPEKLLFIGYAYSKEALLKKAEAILLSLNLDILTQNKFNKLLLFSGE